ncbi:MAG: valine--tRNA ligase [Candidatus Omnitrophica bacterium]|nr:valine--tRNA ligase [Candidatus Omnitrophota bacterium]
MSSPSAYNPHEVEARWYRQWEAGGCFKPDPSSSGSPFAIVIPPPNVTGILHMGHALNNTLQDIVIRFKRMQGHRALWVPGTDHAGIATQNVVERQLAKEKTTRHQLGREEFVKRVWAWRQEYGSTIVQQLRRLGSSCDWSRERFTMDEGLSQAVETAFLELYRAGLIYRGYYLVNWCPRCQTALSDEEVQHEEIQGHLYHIRYPSAAGGEGLVVATTRPETLLGDVAVAVHPEDERYRSLAGKTLLLPILKRPLKVIADPVVDRAFGTGAVKVTPAHDPVDFLFGQRHGLEAIRVMSAEGRMNEQAGPYAGMDRFECREKILEDLAAQGLLVKTEPHTSAVGHCYRCKTVVEPTLSPQWFVKMAPLAKLGIEAVEKDGLRFVPERWTKVYLDWLANIRDWCISRQIWWGHRIPAWYCRHCYPAFLEKQERGSLSDNLKMDEAQAGIHVGSKPAACRHCKGTDLVQDEDVLDTWFSSWLWPFSTLGWPRETEDLRTFYPTSLLVTGQDIIFFWVARMVMAGKFFLKKIPFREVYIHGIIRVEGGKKMSKSLGNIIDPLQVIDRMGTDALRFSIAHMTSEGQDLYLAEDKFLLGRNFANKLWNAARLILDSPSLPVSQSPIPFNPRSMTLADRWILNRLQRAIQETTDALNSYRFNAASRILYQFLWHEFCDWYLEIAKLQKEGGDPSLAQQTGFIQRTVLEAVLRLLHPFMPFITEEIWQKLQPETLMRAPWPTPNPAWIDPEAEELFGRLDFLVTEVRNIRAFFRVPAKEKVTLLVQGRKGTALLKEHENWLKRLAGIGELTADEKLKRPSGSAVSHLPAAGPFDAWDLVVPLAGLVNLDVERKRIEKEIEALQVRAKAKRSRLADSTFRSKAPPDVIAEEEESLKELGAQLAKWQDSLKQIQ